VWVDVWELGLIPSVAVSAVQISIFSLEKRG
jgi:hypothetical protein